MPPSSKSAKSERQCNQYLSPGMLRYFKCGVPKYGNSCRLFLDVSVAGPAGLPRDVLSASGMRRSTLLELRGMELHEVAHVRRCFAGEVAHGVRHAIVTALPSQLGHG
jgi:hypothetical protein